MAHYSLGWTPSLRDARDFTPAHPQVARLLLGAAPLAPVPPAPLPTRVDLTPGCSPVEDQGSIGSCTAHAVVGLVEFMERKATKRHVDASRLFVYKTTRMLMGVTGDTGANLRDAMKALVLLGAPPEQYYPYDVRQFDAEPPAFTYALAQDWKSVKYFRLDPPAHTPAQNLDGLKRFLAGGLPFMFGFTAYESIFKVGPDGKIPFPAGASDAVAGGHAIDAVGYDDSLVCPGAPDSPGAFRIRNSWGPGWGDKGYAWFPYKYVLARLADDFWGIQSQAWVDTQQFAS